MDELKNKTPEEIVNHPYYVELLSTLKQMTENEHKKIVVSLLGYPHMGKQSILDLIKSLNYKVFKTSVSGIYEVNNIVGK